MPIIPAIQYVTSMWFSAHNTQHCLKQYFYAHKKLCKCIKTGLLKVYMILIYACKRFVHCNVWCDKNLCNHHLTRIIKPTHKNVDLWYVHCCFTYCDRSLGTKIRVDMKVSMTCRRLLDTHPPSLLLTRSELWPQYCVPFHSESPVREGRHKACSWSYNCMWECMSYTILFLMEQINVRN